MNREPKEANRILHFIEKILTNSFADFNCVVSELINIHKTASHSCIVT